MRLIGMIAAVALTAGLGGAALAQAANPFGGFKHDNSLPIEITSDALEVREADQLAIFTGDVIAGQGTLRLNSARLEVYYSSGDAGGDGGEAGAQPGGGAIQKLRAEGDVLLSNGAETAAGDWAVYNVESGEVEMGGGVTLTQGGNAVTGPTLLVNLITGVGKVQGGEGGRVQSTFLPSSAGSGD